MELLIITVLTTTCAIHSPQIRMDQASDCHQHTMQLMGYIAYISIQPDRCFHQKMKQFSKLTLASERASAPVPLSMTSPSCLRGCLHSSFSS